MLISPHTLYSPPSPQVLKAIRAELKRRRLSPADRRLASVVSELALEPIGLPGFNQGIFYAPEALPARVAALAPTLAARSRPTTGTLARLGWIKPTVIKTAKALTLPPIENTKKAVYRLWTKGKTDPEYFLIENRQLVGFDAKLPAAGGLLIWHIDESEHNNNHPGDYWVGLVQADGNQDLEVGRNRGDKGDPYPGEANNRRFDAISTPSSSDQFGRPSGVAVTNITVSQETVKCKVRV